MQTYDAYAWFVVPCSCQVLHFTFDCRAPYATNPPPTCTLRVSRRLQCDISCKKIVGGRWMLVTLCRWEGREGGVLSLLTAASPPGPPSVCASLFSQQRRFRASLLFAPCPYWMLRPSASWRSRPRHGEGGVGARHFAMQRPFSLPPLNDLQHPCMAFNNCSYLCND